MRKTCGLTFGNLRARHPVLQDLVDQPVLLGGLGPQEAVAVVIEEVEDPTQAVAIVLGRSATVAEYRLAGSSWEVLR